MPTAKAIAVPISSASRIDSRDTRASEAGEQEHDDQARRRAGVGHAAVVGQGGVAAHRPEAGDRHQRQADGGDDGPRPAAEKADERREKRRDQQAEEPGHHHRPENAGSPPWPEIAIIVATPEKRRPAPAAMAAEVGQPIV